MKSDDVYDLLEKIVGRLERIEAAVGAGPAPGFVWLRADERIRDTDELDFGCHGTDWRTGHGVGMTVAEARGALDDNCNWRRMVKPNKDSE